MNTARHTADSPEIAVRLETKLALSSTLVISTMLISALAAHLRFRDEQRLHENLSAERLPILSLARDMRYTPLTSVRALETELLVGVDPATAPQARERRHQLLDEEDSTLRALLDPARHLSGDDTVRIRELQAGVARLRSLEDEAESLGSLRTPEGASQAVALVQNEILPLDHQLYLSFHAFAESQQHALDDQIAKLNRSSSSILFTLWASAIGAALFSALICLLIARRVSRTVRRLCERAHAIAAGDLTGEPLALGSADQMIALAEAMERMQNSLGAVIGTVAETAGSLTQSAVSMRTASDLVHRRVDEQTQQTQQTATALQMMSASVAEVSRHTQSAVESARSAAQTAREGGQIVQTTLDVMRSIASAVSDTSSTISLLGEDSRRISQIVTVIDDIARKTNLLALNAAIEAARAGEQGRGFAVVAGEVRHLAESTAKATSEISAMIQGVQSRTATAVASMQAGNVTVEQGVVTTHQAGEALERIIGMAERVERMITQIAIAAGQQATAADQSSASLDAIHMLSNENLAELATTTAGIEKMQRTALTLQQQVERFLLTPCGVTAPARGSQLSVLRAQLIPTN